MWLDWNDTICLFCFYHLHVLSKLFWTNPWCIMIQWFIECVDCMYITFFSSSLEPQNFWCKGNYSQTYFAWNATCFFYPAKVEKLKYQSSAMWLMRVQHQVYIFWWRVGDEYVRFNSNTWQIAHMANLWWLANVHDPLHSVYLLLFYQAEQNWKNPHFTWSVIFSFHIEISSKLLENSWISN